MPTKLATINLKVDDPQRSKQFYLQVLGMTENENFSAPPHFVYLESPAGHLTLAAPSEGVAVAPSASMEVGFETDDLAGVQRRLAAAGVAPFKAQSMDWGETLEGVDTDGYRMVIYAFKRE